MSGDHRTLPQNCPNALIIYQTGQLEEKSEKHINIQKNVDFIKLTYLSFRHSSQLNHFARYPLSGLAGFSTLNADILLQSTSTK